MPPRTEMGIHAHFPLGVCILLRNSRRKRSTENPGQAIPLPPPRQKIPPVLGKIEKKNKRECCDTALYFLIPGSSQERNSCSVSPCIFRDNRKYQHLFYPARAWVFLVAVSSATACPGFSVLRFRRRFLSRMQTPKGKWAWMPISVRGGMDAA